MVGSSKTRGEAQTSEAAVLAAAEKIFVEKGYTGARMQQIADAAGINKAMLHYYFRSKERLFETVFRGIVERTVPTLIAGLSSDLPLGLKVRRFVASYTETLNRSPELARFVLTEMNRDPALADAMIRKHAAPLIPVLREQINEAVGQGRLKPISAEDFLLSLLALCVFPIVARPFLEALCVTDSDSFDALLAARGDSVTAFVFAALQPES